MYATSLGSTTVRRRRLAVAGALTLAAMLVLPSIATAAPSATAAASGHRLSASVTGNQRTGMWRIRVVAPGSLQRIDFVVRNGDITWNGTVRVSRKVDGRWTLVSKRYLTGTRSSLHAASGSGAGVRWNTNSFRLPSNGDARFAISAGLTRTGSYRVVGSVRNAMEAFTYGSWSAVGASTVSR